MRTFFFVIKLLLIFCLYLNSCSKIKSNDFSKYHTCNNLEIIIKNKIISINTFRCSVIICVRNSFNRDIIDLLKYTELKCKSVNKKLIINILVDKNINIKKIIKKLELLNFKNLQILVYNNFKEVNDFISAINKGEKPSKFSSQYDIIFYYFENGIKIKFNEDFLKESNFSKGFIYY